jgi:hypothetical protein
MDATHSIEYLPLLSRGEHRGPRQGACFMEYASYLAGEKWSDHPGCTHALLAGLARRVNDRMGDDARWSLIGLVPDVIGLTTTDPRADAVIARRAAITALPVVSEERQHVMALAILNCERLLADIDGRAGAAMSDRSRLALATAPGAASWAGQRVRDVRPSRRVFRRQTAPAIVRYAVDGIAVACCPDRDERLREMLVGAIDDCRAFCPASDMPREGRSSSLAQRFTRHGNVRPSAGSTARIVP